MSTLSLIRRILNGEGDELTQEEWAAVRNAVDFIRLEGRFIKTGTN